MPAAIDNMQRPVLANCTSICVYLQGVFLLYNLNEMCCNRVHKWMISAFGPPNERLLSCQLKLREIQLGMVKRLNMKLRTSSPAVLYQQCWKLPMNLALKSVTLLETFWSHCHRKTEALMMVRSIDQSA